MIKQIIKNVVRKFGFDIIRYASDIQQPIDIFSLAIEEYMKKGKEKEFFFVQVGANDGETDDPLREHIIRHKLKGLLIEPQPDIYQKLIKNYHNQSQLAFENCAISSQKGTMRMFKVKSDAPLSSYYHAQASFDRNHLIKENIDPKYIEEIRVPTHTLKQLFSKHKIDSITLLQIDTEGHDYEILKSALNSGISPEIINYEHCNLNPYIRYRCKKLLYDYHYRFLEYGKDTLAISLNS